MGTNGHKKTGGRKPGTPNKITSELIVELNTLGFNPAAELVEIIRDARLEYGRSKEIHDAITDNRVASNTKGYVADTGSVYLGIAAKACSDLMRFVYPTRKAIDHTSNGKGLEQSFADMVKSVLQSGNDSGGDSSS